METIIRHTDTETPITVTCSCGEQTTVKWSDAAGKFTPANPNWKFKTLTEIGETVKTAGQNTNQSNGWYCGKPGHHYDLTN